MKTEEHQGGKTPFDRVLDWMAALASILLLAITLIVTYSAILRYLHLTPPIWVLQYTEYGLLWITFLGAAWLQRLDGHIRIDSVITHLPRRIRARLETFNLVLGCLVTLTVFCFALIHCFELFHRGIMEVKATNVPKYVVFCIIPFGSLVLFLQFVRDVWNRFRQ
jgi:C4-dicarboxylate transporter DctQ subunit